MEWLNHSCIDGTGKPTRFPRVGSYLRAEVEGFGS
jgi:hypothetical protein